MSTKRGRGRPRKFDRERTVSAVMDAYWKEGLHGLSVNEVCRRSSLSKTSLYREFGGEDELQDAALERYLAEITAPALASLDVNRPFTATIEIILDFIGSASNGCLLVKMRDARPRLGQRVRHRVDKTVEEARMAYEALFVAALKRGEVRTELSPRLAGHYLDTQITTALRLVGAGEPMDVVLAQARLAFMTLVAAQSLQSLA